MEYVRYTILVYIWVPKAERICCQGVAAAYSKNQGEEVVKMHNVLFIIQE